MSVPCNSMWKWLFMFISSSPESCSRVTLRLPVRNLMKRDTVEVCMETSNWLMDGRYRSKTPTYGIYDVRKSFMVRYQMSYDACHQDIMRLQLCPVGLDTIVAWDDIKLIMIWDCTSRPKVKVHQIHAKQMLTNS